MVSLQYGSGTLFSLDLSYPDFEPRKRGGDETGNWMKGIVGDNGLENGAPKVQLSSLHLTGPGVPRIGHPGIPPLHRLGLFPHRLHISYPSPRKSREGPSTFSPHDASPLRDTPRDRPTSRFHRRLITHMPAKSPRRRVRGSGKNRSYNHVRPCRR